jgi:CheY-like chemotaxis protein
MAEVTLKVLIIDEQQERIRLLKSFMPAYITTQAAIYGDAARSIIEAGDIDLIVMYADDIKGHGLYMFGWLKKDSQYKKIPVILLTKDEFSERSLDFIELGDAVFYEGELEQFRFFQMMSELLEETETREYMEEIQTEQAMLNAEKLSGWVSAGAGVVADIVAAEKARMAAVAAEPKPWQADSAAMVREILKARSSRAEEEEDEYTRGMNKAVVFAEAVQSTKVHAAPAHTV